MATTNWRQMIMENIVKSPILQKEINQFLKSNDKIKEALDIFKISDDQYNKAMRSIEPKVTTSNKTTIVIEV